MEKQKIALGLRGSFGIVAMFMAVLLLVGALQILPNYAQAASSTEPMISNIAASSTTGGTGAILTWMTDMPATSQVVYGTTTNYGIFSQLNNTATTSHMLSLFGLTPSTTYHFAAMSGLSTSSATSSAMATSTSLDQIFTTAASSTTSAATSSATSTSAVAPSYCPTQNTTEGYFTTTDKASYQQGETVNICMVDNTRTPLFLQGTHPWQIENASGSLVFTPTQGIAASTTGTSFFTDSWNGNATTTASSSPITSGTYTVVFPGFPGTPSAVFSILSTSTATSTNNGGGTSTSTATTTPSDLNSLVTQLEKLQFLFPQFSSPLQNLINELLGIGTSTPGIPNTGTSASTTTSSGRIDQDGQTFTAGTSIDFGGHNFGHGEQIIISLSGVQVGQAHADSGGNFSTGSMGLPSTPGTYTYTFMEPGGATAQATIHLVP